MTRLALAVVLFALPALARPTLHNRDERRYDFSLECRDSTEHGHVAGQATAPLASRCTLTVKGLGSAKVHADSRCVIRAATLGCT